MILPTLAAAWSKALLDYTLTLGVVLIGFSMLCCVWRLIRGPHLADRALAVDTFAILLVGMVILFAIRFQTAWFADGVMVLALLGFAGTVAMAQYIGRPHLRKTAAGSDAQETSR